MTTASRSIWQRTTLFRDTPASAKSFFAQWLSTVLGADSNAMERELSQLEPMTKWSLVGFAVLLIGLTVLVFVGVVSVYQARSTFSSGPKGDLPAARSTASMDAILERPVFRRSRTAIASSELRQPIASVLSKDGLAEFSLKGVFLNGAVARAFLSTSANPKGTWYGLNEEVEGRILVEVHPSSVALDVMGQRQTIPLRVDGPLR